VPYDIPDGNTWVRADQAGLDRLARDTAKSNLMRSEPDNSGCTFEQACTILKMMASRSDDLSDVIPDDLD
jgi:hypothetical protein